MTATPPTADTWWVEVFVGDADGASTATARALATLAHQLLEAAADDIDEVTHDLVSVAALERDPTIEDPTVSPLTDRTQPEGACDEGSSRDQF